MQFIVNNNVIDIGKNEFIGSGGQANVYCLGNTAYKIYTDPTQMIPIAKIKELALLTNPSIIKPNDLIIDKKRTPVGYTMRYLKDTYVLCQMLTKTFCDKHRLDNASIIKLIGKIRSIYQSAHAAKCLIVDGNEMNFLLDGNFNDVYVIDVDSWQTPSFKATAIMDSIRDRHVNNYDFNEGSDWFAFAIVSCYMMMKIHPFKGKHPSITNIDDRMARNVSIFNKDVSLPGMCPAFNVIPQNYIDWYKAVFEKGMRCPPPDALQAVILLATKQVVIGGKHFIVTDFEKFPENVIRYCVAQNGIKVVITSIGHYLGGKKDTVVLPNPAIGGNPDGSIIMASMDGIRLKLRNLTWFKDVVHSISAEKVMDYNGTIYIKNKDSILELLVVEPANPPGTTLVSVKSVANVMEKATQLFDGVVIQNLLGTFYTTIFPKRGLSYNVRLKELDKYKILDGKFDNGVLMVAVATTAGEYEKFIFRFDPTFSEYDLRIEKCQQVPTLNFVVIDSHICAHKTDDEKLELFRGFKDGGAAAVFDEPAVKGDVKMFKLGKQVLFSKDDQIYSIAKKT